MLTVDTEAKTGTCQHCGDVKVVIKGKSALCSVSQKRWVTGRGLRLIPEGQRCLLCGSDQKLVRDHDHTCCDVPGRESCGTCFRGWLCRLCNTGLGMFRDDPLVLERAAKYLREWSSSKP